jgi:hypothetical protein
MWVVTLEGKNYGLLTVKELLDALLVEACGRGDAETEDHGVEEALAVAGKVDELAGKMEQMEARLRRLETQVDP